ncbi:hypothetical protein KY290_030017 [Solanum tuberosum]|uniref:Uncharacterized protein n=1 Tax=Solanum tuberosum TaxID=4113 RepID=A0ABQ7UMD9_SOLTU|nr:hypothetical protein KY284_026793 [Solanum tuberosum]KAH0750785.1 hypothetical protein KY290_030017 [Solanum tuberosum]
MAQNEIEEMLDHLRRIKSGGNLSSFKIDQIEKLEMVLRVFKNFMKYHHVLLPDSLVKLTKKAKLTMKMLQLLFRRIPKVQKANHNLERLESYLLEFFEGKTSLSYNYEKNDFDLSKYMDCLGNNLNDVLMMLLEGVMSDSPEEKLAIHRFIKQLKIVQKKMSFLRYLYDTEINGNVEEEKLECLETQIQFMANNVVQLCHAVSVNVVADFVNDKDEFDRYEYDIFNKPPYLLCLIVLVELEMKKIFLSELKASKFTQSRTFKGKKLPKGFSHHLHSLLMYLRNKKLEIFPNNISAQNIDVAIEFMLVFLDTDVSNHVISGKWLNEVMEKAGAIAGDILYVVQKLLPSSLNKDDSSKISLSSIKILEKTKDLNEQVETCYKSLKFTPSQFPSSGGLRFLDSLLRKLNEMSKSKSGLDFLMKPLLGNLEEELSVLTSILEKELSSLSSIFIDVAKVHHEHKILKDLHRQTINLANEAEVAIDSILSKYNVFLHIFCSLPTILKEIKQINVKVIEMGPVDVAHYAVEPSKHLPTRHSNPVSDEDIVGFEIATEKLIQYLTQGRSELDVIPIVGMGGQGKTTCARMLYDNRIIISHFDVRAWCTVSQTYNRRELLQDIFSQVTDSEDKGDKDDVLADMLRKNLIGKRYIIVLDDMWDGMAWEDLRLSFPDVGNRSRIIVTTRLEKVGEQVMHYIDPCHLPSLTTKESCQLLQRKVFQKEDCPPELQDVSQAVAEKCKGLPLVVVLLAGIIKKRKMEESWWNEVKDALFDYLDRELEEYSLATMQLSFDNLPHCLKPCLLYMGMFPEDTRIPVSKLISVWTAEGFVQNIESAEDYLMDLINSNVVMVSKKSYDGKVKICQVHDVVRHFCLERSREENFMLAVKGHASQFQPVHWKGSRVSFSFSEEHSKFGSLGSKTRKPFHQHLRSLITTNGGIFYNWNPFCQISELRLVKVLDLSSHRVDRFSSATLKPLNHLKYLAVWANKFYFHPESHLPHIETLILKNLIPDTDLDNKVVLPASFWEMKKLWHVEIRGSLVVKNNAEFDKHGLFEGSSKLENLRYLRRAVIDETDSVDVLVSRCPNLQQLHITFEDNYPSAKLEDLTHLQILHLSFRWSHCPSVLQLPLNLKKLVLFGIRIKNTIPFIVGPSSLEYLQLQNLYFPRSKEWCLGDIAFPNLKLLKLVSLDISRWDASEESFPLLETLVSEHALEASAVKIKEEVEAIEGCDRIDITTQEVWERNIRRL